MNKYISSMDELSSRLRYIREWFELSQEDVSSYLNINRSTYSYYETGKSIPTIFTLFKLCELFKININYFLLKNNKFIIQSIKKDPLFQNT